MESFGTYIDHLILLLAARFQAPLEVSTEELLSPVDGTTEYDPWELVARTIQLSLCGPQTPQERLYMRQLDVCHFSAPVCRERARYVRWKLSEGQRNGRAVKPASSGAAGAQTATARADANAAAPEARTFDVTRDSLHRDVTALYALVRQSLPSTLDNDDEKEESDAEDGDTPHDSAHPTETAAAAQVNTAAANALSSQIHEVFVRTAEERHRDEQVAHARDEFLSQIQALQMVYYNKYHRWMDAPENVLEPPQTAVATASSSRRSSMSVHGAAAASPAAAHRSRQEKQTSEEEEEERAALLAALSSVRSGHPAPHTQPASVPTSNVRTGAHPAIATMRRQVHLQRPLRPSAVPDDALESLHRAHPESRAARRESGGGGSNSGSLGASRKGLVAPAATTAASAAFSAAMHATAAPTPGVAAAQATHVTPAMKETAPPVSRRGRWQIVEYGDDGEEGEEGD